MAATTLTNLVLGLVLLILGADLLVRGAARLASMLGVAPLLIGLTVVAYGTGSPELAVGMHAGGNGEAALAIGNVVGSNIFNVLFILGISALARPIIVHDQLVRTDVPIMIIASAAVFLLAFNGAISRAEGLLLLPGIIAYTMFLAWLGRRQRTERADGQANDDSLPSEKPVQRKARDWLANFGLVLGGLALLMAGARWLVEGAVEMAVALGVSQLVIGITIVAAGTSLPEVATSVVAALRNERDIAVGNVIGSNIFNIFAVLGAAALASPGGLAVPNAARTFDIPVMFAVAVACLPIFMANGRISRWQGALFFGYWFAYAAWVILAASEHNALDEYRSVMMTFVLPLTVLITALTLYRSGRRRARAAG